METSIITSQKYSLNWRDVSKGLIVAALTPVLVIIQNSLDAGSLTFNWKNIGISAVAGMLAYLVKNFFTPAQVITTEKPQ